MKTGIITCALTALALSAGITSHAQTVSDKKAKRQKEEVVNVRVWLNKGEDKVIDGYLRSALVNRPENIEISLTADGKRMRYVNEDVDSLLLDGSDKYVKRLVKMYGALGGPAKVEWVREEYRGKGIDLYSLFTVEAERTGRNITVVRPVRSWYLSIAGDMAIMVGSDTRNSIFDKAEPSMSGAMLNKYFGKIYDYPEFAARIREGEFSTFMDVIHAWEASYGGTALRVDGKLKDGQVGVQGGIASSDANKNVDWKRTKSEIVFPKYTRTIQVGASPVIAEWTKVMKHATDDSKSSFKMAVPPIMIYSDICFLDFGRFGSLGWSIGGEYSRYSYNWMLDNGYGDKQQDTYCNRVDFAAIFQDNYELARKARLEHEWNKVVEYAEKALAVKNNSELNGWIVEARESLINEDLKHKQEEFNLAFVNEQWNRVVELYNSNEFLHKKCSNSKMYDKARRIIKSGKPSTSVETSPIISDKGPDITMIGSTKRNPKNLGNSVHEKERRPRTTRPKVAGRPQVKETDAASKKQNTKKMHQRPNRVLLNERLDRNDRNAESTQNIKVINKPKR